MSAAKWTICRDIAAPGSDDMSAIIWARSDADGCGVVDGRATFVSRDCALRVVAAINSHDDLLAACEGLLACIEAEWGADFLPYNLSDEEAAQANAAVLAARAAVAKAVRP